MGRSPKADLTALSPWPAEEKDPTFWNHQAAQALDTAKKLQPIRTAAKNLILFLGDGECAWHVRSQSPTVLVPRATYGHSLACGLRPDRVPLFQGWGCPQ